MRSGGKAAELLRCGGRRSGHGDTGEQYADALAGNTFTITGVVQSPLYISIERGTSSLGDGSVDEYMLLPESSFQLDYYTLCNVTVAGAKKLDAYSQNTRQIRCSDPAGLPMPQRSGHSSDMKACERMPSSRWTMPGSS